MIYRISKKGKTLKGTIQLTPSKSISNRVLIIRSLCEDEFRIENLATANDTVLLQKLLNSTSHILDAEDAGTTFRFLVAYLSQKPGEWTLTGTDRMKQRPVGILVDALRTLGADISYEANDHFPPLKITGKKINGGEIEINGSVSSQFISALLLIAPTLENGLTLKLIGEITSRPYIEMTLGLMNEFGIESDWNKVGIFISHQKYIAKNISIESDWSAASYWFEMAAFADDADLTLIGLRKNSIQGDSVIAEIMKQFGVETEFIKDAVRLKKNSQVNLPKQLAYDFKSIPDLVQTMAVTCAASGVEASFTGIQNLRIKETDRLHALCEELNRVGVKATISTISARLVSGGFRFQISDPDLQPPTSIFQSHNDHRMAMSLAPLALKFGNIEIENPDVVKKSYPEFWDDLMKAGFEIEEVNSI
jgi:3-phosphoshikimate 1-carboxyvinyltransferase